MSNEPNPQLQEPQAPGHPPAPNGGSRQNSRSSQDHESAPEHKAVSGRGAVVGVTIVLIAIVALAARGIWKRHHNDEVLADTTQRLSAPSVIAIPPRPGAPVDTFVLPGNVSAYPDSPI